MDFYATIDSTMDARTLHAAMPPGVAYMLPASSWSNVRLRAPRIPAHVTRCAADSGGFVATFIHGDYRYSPAEYVAWLRRWPILPEFAATMDYCCEREVAPGSEVVRARQARTTAMAYLFWREYKAEPWVWVPTIQGAHGADYVRHARDLRPLIAEMAAYYGHGSAFRVGVGTLCRRKHSEAVRDILRAVANELPGVPLHAWGVKAMEGQLPSAVMSVDSAAWNGRFGRDLTRHREAQRVLGMTQRAYGFRVLLPAYLARIQARTTTDNGPQAGGLWDTAHNTARQVA